MLQFVRENWLWILLPVVLTGLALAAWALLGEPGDGGPEVTYDVF